MSHLTNRRQLIKSLAIAGVGLMIPGCSRQSSTTRGGQGRSAKPEEQVTVGEDLMREHGLLERVLLIYEEIQHGSHPLSLKKQIAGDASSIIRHFIEDYHEKLEEDYLFPQFKKAHHLVDLVQTLKTQHDAGRRIISQLLNIASSSSPLNLQSEKQVNSLTAEFIHMYRPHYAREDTIIFREFPDLIGATEYRRLGEKFEDREHQLFGENGFESYIGKIETLEKKLGIYDLNKFTPS